MVQWSIELKSVMSKNGVNAWSREDMASCYCSIFQLWYTL